MGVRLRCSSRFNSHRVITRVWALYVCHSYPGHLHSRGNGMLRGPTFQRVALVFCPLASINNGRFQGYGSYQFKIYTAYRGVPVLRANRLLWELSKHANIGPKFTWLLRGFVMWACSYIYSADVNATYWMLDVVALGVCIKSSVSTVPMGFT